MSIDRLLLRTEYWCACINLSSNGRRLVWTLENPAFELFRQSNINIIYKTLERGKIW